jgi:hypothetical protein
MSLASRVASRYLEAANPLPDFWVERDEIAQICPPCAERMASLNITKVLASSIFGHDMLLLAADANTAAKWKGLPKGWTQESVKKFWKSVGESVSKCSDKMEGKVDDPGAFCSSLKDRLEGKAWRHEKRK